MRNCDMSGLLAVSLGCLLLCASAFGQKPSAGVSTPDEPAIHDYILTMDKIQKYVEVAGKGGAAAQSVLCSLRR